MEHCELEKLLEEIHAFYDFCDMLDSVDDLFKPAAGLLEESERLRDRLAEPICEIGDELGGWASTDEMDREIVEDFIEGLHLHWEVERMRRICANHDPSVAYENLPPLNFSEGESRNLREFMEEQLPKVPPMFLGDLDTWKS